MSDSQVQAKVRIQPSILRWAGFTAPRFWLMVALTLVALRSGLAVVTTTHANRFAFNELQELREQSNQLDIEWGQLLIEQSTFGVNGRIQSKAVEQLEMIIPDEQHIVMVPYGK